ncbi:hypothetical protein LRS10_02050 [Phenylobacterium sp. J426]|uniref:hypothetical protein n=1 Tax=Phenylobacterium sp. J426 TaxID=2898439 RepID=UPI0008C608DF|nr:hypothetical protein [Phenylobacterium sp. J426]MCR5873084.1 hypothetical protein [Phenylobacterium sp. J426]OHB40673.1 MAG: hypothetical protein A2882_01135 [Phenylobacterium sp. RIFCSPHIGHO2_01_FULL_70_10]
MTLKAAADHTEEYRSTSFDPLDVRPAVADLQDYAEDLAARHGLHVVINPENLVELDASALAGSAIEG